MSIYLLYALLPLIVFPLTSVFLTKLSRETGSLLTTFLRQISILVFWIPIIFLTPDFFTLVIKYGKEIFISGIWASLYLYSVFKSYDHVELIQWRVVNVISRVLISVAVWMIILWEKLSFYQSMGVCIILIGISFYLKIRNENTLPKYNLMLWVTLSILGAGFFVMNWYYFSIYAQEFPPFMSAYVLEISSIPLLICMVLLSKERDNFKRVFNFSLNDWRLLLWWSIPALLWSYWLAMSYIHLDFIVVNILFCATLIMAGLFAWLILWEKLTKLQMLIFSCILIGIFMVNYF